MAADAATLRLRDDPRAISAAAVGVILIATALRAWYSLGGWFYGDDFEFLTEMTRDGLTWSSVLAPHDSQFMPGGKVAAWLITLAGPFAWTVAAVQLIGLQGIALTMGWLCLRRLFGAGPLSVGLLAVYAFTPLTITSFMWWSSAINQIPLAIAFFGATYAYVGYLRDPRWRGALQTAAWVAFGLLFYVKAALIVVFLAVLTVLYTVPGSAWRRPGPTLLKLFRRLPHAASLLGILGLSYSIYYVSAVPNPVSSEGSVDYLGLADTMFRRSLGTAMTGGPWRWDLLNPPVAIVGTPEWAITLTWFAIGACAAWLVAHHRFDPRALLLIAAYLGISLILTAQGRGVFLGPIAGLELRYLADAAAPFIVCVGLLVSRLELIGTHARLGEARTTSAQLHPVLAVGPLVVVLSGSLISTTVYAGFWNTYPARDFVINATEASRDAPLHLADEPVPEAVMSGASFPDNLPSRLLRPLGDRVQTYKVGTDLAALNDEGRPFPAYVPSGAAAPEGTLSGCGHSVTDVPETLPLTGAPQDYFWWAQVSYLASADGRLQIEIGGGPSRSVEVQSGVHTAYFQGEGPAPNVTLVTSNANLTVCVDRVMIGDLGTLEPVQ